MKVKGMVPVERILPIINDYVEKNNYQFTRGELVGGKKKFSYVTGLSLRWVYSVYSGEKKQVDATSLDKILTALDLTHLTHWEEEDGGFKDVFDNLPPVMVRGPYEKKGGKKTLCECGGMKHHKAKLCQPCRLVANAKKKSFCEDCGTVIGGKGAKRCWPCWDKFRKSDKKARAAYIERRDGMRRVLKKRITTLDTPS